MKSFMNQIETFLNKIIFCKNKEKLEITPTAIINDINDLLLKMKGVLKDKYDKKNLNDLDDKI